MVSTKEWSLFKEISTYNIERESDTSYLFYLYVMMQLALANPGKLVIEKLHESDLTKLIGEDNIYITVANDVNYCYNKVVEDD